MLDFFSYNNWILQALVWIPIVGMVHVLCSSEERAKYLALGWSTAVLVLSLGLWWAYDPTVNIGGYQLTSSYPWIQQWGVDFSLGIDGISLFLVLLSTLTTPIAILGSFNYITKKEKAFYALMLLLEFGIVGVFTALDLFLFYVFFERVLSGGFFHHRGFDDGFL